LRLVPGQSVEINSLTTLKPTQLPMTVRRRTPNDGLSKANASR
jgi:hypothetical protein